MIYLLTCRATSFQGEIKFLCVCTFVQIRISVWAVLGPVHMSPARSTGPARSRVHMRNSARLPRRKRRRGACIYFKYGATRSYFDRALVVELSTRVTLLLQLNGILLKWKIQQISQNAATEAAKRPFSHAQLKYFHPGQPRSRSPRPRSRLTGLSRFSYEHIGIFTKEIVGGRDLA